MRDECVNVIKICLLFSFGASSDKAALPPATTPLQKKPNNNQTKNNQTKDNHNVTERLLPSKRLIKGHSCL